MSNITKNLPTTEPARLCAVERDVLRYRLLTAEVEKLETELETVKVRLEENIGTGEQVLVDGYTVTCVSQDRRSLDIDTLQVTASRRLFSLVTRRSMDWTTWDAMSRVGKLPAEVAALVKTTPTKAYFVDGWAKRKG